MSEGYNENPLPWRRFVAIWCAILSAMALCVFLINMYNKPDNQLSIVKPLAIRPLGRVDLCTLHYSLEEWRVVS